jgi:xanthine/uracil permease
VAWTNFQQDALLGAITLAACILFAVFFRGFLGRISIFLGVVVGYVVAAILGRVDWSGVADAAWIGLPSSTCPRSATRTPGRCCRCSCP